MAKRREIRVSPSLRKELNSRYAVITVRRALRGDTMTDLAQKIREYALENGGVYV